MSESRPVMKSRRRNGQEASCEPCRLSKQRCDHARPVCGRCVKRDIQGNCFYHPAPLSRARLSEPIKTPPLRLAEGDAVERTADSSVSGSAHASPASRRTTSSVKATPSSGSMKKSTTASVTSLAHTGGDHDEQERLGLVVEVLSALKDFDLIRDLVQDYYPYSVAANIVSPLILPAVVSMTALVGVSQVFDQRDDGSTQLQRVAKSILSTVREPIPISSDMTAAEFLARHTGSNIRLEFLGSLYATAGRVYLSSMGGSGVDDDFTRTMNRCTGICYRMARQLTPMNDWLLWLSLERGYLASNVYGDQSEEVWQCLGDISSDILAFNAHRETLWSQDCPFFLAECRRRLVAKAHYFDVCISTRIDRPPRLSKRFLDIRPPLDLSDKEVVGTPEEVAMACNKLNANGWNMESMEYYPSSFSRLRYAMARTREDVWEQALDLSRPGSVARLEEISQRNREIWDNVPARLQYTFQCWQSSLSERVCQYMLNMWLTSAGTEMHICRYLKRVLGADPRATVPLLAISYGIVNSISQLGTLRKKLAVYDFSFQFLCHGLPAAAVLIETLQSIARHGPTAVSLPAGVTTPSIIRLLSVLASQLKAACEPQQANYAACMQASEAIGSSLDDALKGAFDTTQRALPPTPVTVNSLDPADVHAFAEPLWNDSEIATLLKDIDWNNISTEWDFM